MLDRVLILFFITSAVWGNAIDGINLPAIGSLFPLRAFVFLFAVFIWYKAFILRENVVLIYSDGTKASGMRNTTLYTFVAMMIFGMVTIYWAHSFSAVLIHLFTWLTVFACIAISLSLLKTRESIIFAAGVFVLNYLAISGIGIYEVFTGDYYDLAYEYYTRQFNIFGLYRPVSIMYNTNNLAILSALTLPMGFIATSGQKKTKGLLDILLMLFILFNIVMTSCNTALILFCLIVGMYVFMNRERKTSWIIIGSVVLFLLIGSSLVLNVFNELMNYSLKDELRFDIWKNAWEVSWKYGLMGVGPGNSTIMNDIYKTSDVHTSATHNFLLTIFEEFGIIGFSFFFFWISKLFYNIFSIYRATRDVLMKNAVIFCVVFLLSTFCMSTMINYYFYWAEFGIIMAMMECLEKETHEKDQPERKIK